MAVLIGVASWVAAASGIWLGTRLTTSPIKARWLLMAAALVALAVPGFGLPRLVAAPLIGLGIGVAATTAWWSSVPESRRRVARSFPPDAIPSIVWHELMGSVYAVFVVTSILAMVVGLVVAWWPGAIAAVVILLAAAWRLSSLWPDRPNGPTPDGLVEMVETRDGAERRAVVDRLVDTDPGLHVVAPHELFRGLVGWNLGLGLDTESAAWAAQLGRKHGLGGLLSEPETMADDEAAAVLVTCRAVSHGQGPIVVELPAGQAQHVTRRIARIVAEHRADRSVIVVTDDPASGRSFLARSR